MKSATTASLITATLIIGIEVAPLLAEILTPVSVIATSEFGEVDVFGTGEFSMIFAMSLIDGSGLIDEDDRLVHDFDPNASTMWHAGDFDAGIPGGLDGDGDPLTPPPVDEQVLEFDLGASYTLSSALIWQMNQSGLGVALASDRGVDELEILVSGSDAGEDFTSLGFFNLNPEAGVEHVPAQVVALSGEAASQVRRVRFDINTAHNRDGFPRDNEFVGLSEVRFDGKLVGALDPGDADQDFDFDQLDLVQVQQAAKYLTGQPATWGQGDWDGAPGGSPGSPPPGDGLFNQIDVISALTAGNYLTGPYAAVLQNGQAGDGQTSIRYHAQTGEVAVDAPRGTELTSVNIDSASGIFTGDLAHNLGGSFDNHANNNIFKATFGSSFGSLSFGKVAQVGLSEEFVLSDLSVVGSLAGGGDLRDVDLVYVPEPASALLLVLGGVVAIIRFRCSIS